MFEKKLQSLSLKNKLNYGYKFIIMLMIISGFFAIVSLTVFFVTIQGGMSGGQLGAGAVKNNLIHFIASIVFIVMFIIAAVIVARKIGNYAVNSITQPIAEIEKVAKDLAAGDLHSELEFHSDDEVGLLAHNMRKSIRILGSYVDDISRAMSEFSKGNFDVHPEVEWKGDFKGILDSFMMFEESMATTVKRIQSVADEVASGSEQVSDSSTNLAEGAAEQASITQELAATITEVSEEVSQNAESAKKISNKVDELGTEIATGNGKMQEMVQSMSDISEASEQIGKIIATINDIASPDKSVSVKCID